MDDEENNFRVVPIPSFYFPPHPSPSIPIHPTTYSNSTYSTIQYAPHPALSVRTPIPFPCSSSSSSSPRRLSNHPSSHVKTSALPSLSLCLSLCPALPLRLRLVTTTGSYQIPPPRSRSSPAHLTFCDLSLKILRGEAERNGWMDVRGGRWALSHGNAAAIWECCCGMYGCCCRVQCKGGAEGWGWMR